MKDRRVQALSPIIVVGASRSGTSLMRACLNNHPAVHLVGETHYFDDLRPKMGIKAMEPLTPNEARRCEDYFLAISHRPYGHGGDPAKASLPRTTLVARARELGPGADSYLEAFCRLQAESVGATRWGEKTPRHVYRIAEILERYPDARVVVMVRDPRSVIASYRDWRHQGGFDLERDPLHAEALERDERRARDSYHVVIQTMLWRSAANAGVRARKRFGADRVCVQRYEDLVATPEDTLRGICDWLAIAPHPGMLDVPVHNSSFTTFTAASGISSEPLQRWRKKLSDDEVGLVQRVAGATMTAQRYERELVRPTFTSTVGTLLSVPWVALRGANVNRDRLGTSLPRYVWRRLRAIRTV